MKIKISVSTGYVGSRKEGILEFEDQEFEGMTQEEKDNYINSEVLDYMLGDMLDWTWWEEE